MTEIKGGVDDPGGTGRGAGTAPDADRIHILQGQGEGWPDDLFVPRGPEARKQDPTRCASKCPQEISAASTRSARDAFQGFLSGKEIPQIGEQPLHSPQRTDR